MDSLPVFPWLTPPPPYPHLFPAHLCVSASLLAGLLCTVHHQVLLSLVSSWAQLMRAAQDQEDETAKPSHSARVGASQTILSFVPGSQPQDLSELSRGSREQKGRRGGVCILGQVSWLAL